VTAAVDMKSACDLAYRSSQKFPKQLEHQKLIGIFHVAMATLPRKLLWIGNVLCYKGDMETGVKQLEEIARRGRMLPIEAEILLFYFEKNLFSHPEAALARARAMQAKRPDSKLFNYFLLSSHIELRDMDGAIDLAKAKEQLFASTSPAMALPIWHYTVGKAYFFRLDYPQAIANFDRFLGLYKGRTLRADALYRKGVSLLLLHKHDEAKAVFLKFAGLPESEFDADEYALKQAANYLIKEPGPIDKRLYAARNLFDGGYYQRALDSLNPLITATTLTENQRTELHYRLGRIRHAIADLPAARKQYEMCIATLPGAALWMKVYAMYYLAKIEETEGYFEKARILYRTALSHDGYPYQSGLEQRCKSALAELKREKSGPSPK
jgi:tetratricopeptide (TPR) repeat protein